MSMQFTTSGSQIVNLGLLSWALTLLFPIAGSCEPIALPSLNPETKIATFSIVAVDPETGECGAAVASKYPAVGRVVTYVKADVGAFCTQHYHVPQWGPVAIELLTEKKSPQQVIAALLETDAHPDQRQLAVINMQGNVAQHHPTGAPKQSHYWGGRSGKFYACQGNTLAGSQVITAMGDAYEKTKGTLTDRLMAALIAGDMAGGDHRGRLAAGIQVAKSGKPGLWFELYVDKSDDAVKELMDKYQKIDHPAKGK
ncbi:MAG: hypothetical protein COA78_30720 [Blastopirellula sp.]|nr:MAG: hypothetical protein COA78_30720 [Blastopirellula sp.]